MSRFRRYENGKPAPIDVATIDAWLRLTGRGELDPFELDTIALLDRVYLQVQYSDDAGASPGDVATNLATGLRHMAGGNKKQGPDIVLRPDIKPTL